jgi:hypothetical protein
LEGWTDQGWGEKEKYEGTFDNNGNATGLNYSLWNNTLWVVEMALFFDLTYNESDDVTEMVIRFWDPSLTAPKNLSKYIYSNFLHFITKVPEINVPGIVKVFPNPVKSIFTILIDENKITNYQVNIVNLAGQTIFSNTYSNPSISINTEGFTPGVYLMNIKSDEGKIYAGKLLKN